MKIITEEGPRCGTRSLCAAFALPTATFYRARVASYRTTRVPTQRVAPPRALPLAERQQVLGVFSRNDAAPGPYCPIPM